MESSNEEIKVTYVNLDKYEKLVDGIYKKCDQWISGKVSRENIVSMFNHIYQKGYMVKEVNDDDCDEVSDEIYDRSQKAWQRMYQLQFLFGAIASFPDSEKEASAIKKAWIITGSLEKFNFDFDLL